VISILILNAYRQLFSLTLSTAPIDWNPGVQDLGTLISITSTIDVKQNKTANEREKEHIMNATSKMPLETFLQNETTTPEAKFLLDFVVAGFPKCGTTTLGEWLSEHPEIKMQIGEQYHFSMSIQKSVRKLHNFLPENRTDRMRLKRGFRCPHHIQHPRGLKILREVYTEAKVIVSVRHPVLWFESFYNYRLEQNEGALLKGTPNELIGELTCRQCKSPLYLSTATGAFHQYLARLQQTPLSDPKEMALLDPFTPERVKLRQHTGLPNSIFFLEISQLGDQNATRSEIFRKDLQQFLGLEQELPPIPHLRPRNKSTKKPANATKIDICEAQYDPVRTEMLHISQNASLWFRNFFFESEDVYSSSREYLEEILERWMVDPCIERRKRFEYL
jgi:hypothetical protein